MEKQKRTGRGALLLQHRLAREESGTFISGSLFLCPMFRGNFKIGQALEQVPIGCGVSIP